MFFNPLCRFADRFPHLAAQILQRDRFKTRNFREETITDVLMAGLVGLEPYGIRVDFPRSEKATGNDMEWHFVAPQNVRGQRYLRLNIQAKRASFLSGGKTNPSYWRYAHLDYDNGAQASALIAEAAKIPGCVPLYMFYHPTDATEPATESLPAVEGVSAMLAHGVPAVIGKGCTSSQKAVSFWRPDFFPLHDLLCWPISMPAMEVYPDEDFPLFLAFLEPADGLLLRVSPQRLAEKLEEHRRRLADRKGVADTEAVQPIAAVDAIPPSILRAINGEVSTEERDQLPRPRAIFVSGRHEWPLDGTQR